MKLGTPSPSSTSDDSNNLQDVILTEDRSTCFRRGEGTAIVLHDNALRIESQKIEEFDERTAMSHLIGLAVYRDRDGARFAHGLRYVY
jgi:hypothetical protein